MENDREDIYPVRVLNIVTQMNRAGMESRLMDIYRNIDREKIQFDFYTFRESEGDFDEEILLMGGSVFYNKPLTLMSMKKSKMGFLEFLKLNREYDIIHSHINQWNGIFMKTAFYSGIKTRISHSRTSLEKTNIKNIIKNMIKLYGRNYATDYFAVSNKAGKWLFGESIMNSSKYKVWPNAIDTNKFKFDKNLREEARRDLGIQDSFVVMHVGNIRKEKNHLFLIDVFSELLKVKPNSNLLIIGKDYMDGAINKYVEYKGIENNVKFLGSITDVNHILQAGDIFVFPSFYEGFPGSLLEAQTNGLPCVISDTITDEVCITKLVNKLSLKSDVSEWIQKIIELSELERYDNSEHIRENGYDINILVNRLQKFYIEKYMIRGI